MAECIALPYEATEYHKGLEESLDIESGVFTASRVFDVPWDNRYAFINLFLPLFTSDQNTIRSARVYPAFQAAVAYRYDLLEKLGPSSQFGPTEKFIDDNDIETNVPFIGYEKARLKILYKADAALSSTGGTGQDPDTEPKLKFEVSGDGEITLLSLAGRDVFDEEGKRKPGTKYNLPISIYNIKINYPEISNPGFSSILNNGAKLNENEISFIDNNGVVLFVFPKGTLRYDGPSFVGRMSLYGTTSKLSWSISHNFAYNLYRWDQKIKSVSFTPISGSPYNYLFEKVTLQPYTLDNFAFIPHFQATG